VTLWAEDEHRLGLLPVVRRTARVRRRYEWCYVYGVVRPATGASWWCLLPEVSAEAFGLALAEFARDEGIGPGRRAVLAVDQAGWHLAKGLAVPEGVHLALLPAHSPELQPAERLWPLLDEAVANRAFADLDALEAALVARCRALMADRRTVKAHARFHWWPRERRRRRPR
jgi:hypothetical protein